jgi:hypothetical protein
MQTLNRHGPPATPGQIAMTVMAIAWVLTSLGFRPQRPAATFPAPLLARPPAAWRMPPTVPQDLTPPVREPKTRGTQVRGQLRARGRWLVYPDGSRFRWRGVTGFMLNEQVSSGREADAVAFLAWANRTGFSVVRVLVMLPKGWFTDKDFTPEEGLAALPRTLELARAADMYVEVTVLANTAALPARADLGSYVERAGQICSTAENCALVEVANEIFHDAQRADVHDPTSLARWAARVPAGIPTALGAPARSSGTLVAAAPVITMHLDRDGDRWTRVGLMRDLESLSATTNRFVIDNEPLGADEVEQFPRRDNLPDTFLAQGTLSRVLEVGSNFHFEDGLRAKVPRPVQQRCAEAFVAGTRIVDDSYMLTFQNAGGPYSPVKQLRFADGQAVPATPGREQTGVRPDVVVAAYAGLTQVFPSNSAPASVLLLIGVAGEPIIEWRPPWRKTGVIVESPHVRIWSIARGP